MSALLGLIAGFPLEAAFRRGKKGFFLGALGAGVLGVAVLFSGAAPRWLRYNPDDPARMERLTIWSLTLPQVAATLAAALVAFDTLDASHQRLIDSRMLNVVLALMLFTSIVGPILTERLAPHLVPKQTADQQQRAA
jgi:Kef-type K+ transport system membrane component KefB